jgi:hypothetical protein
MASSSTIDIKQNLYAEITLLLLSLSERRILRREVSLYLSVLSQDVIDILTVDDLERIRERLDAWDLIGCVADGSWKPGGTQAEGIKSLRARRSK